MEDVPAIGAEEIRAISNGYHEEWLLWQEERKRLHQAIRNQCGDNLCWISDDIQAKALPEKEFLESCKRYRQQLVAGVGAYTEGRTIAQLESLVLEAELALLKIQEYVHGYASVENKIYFCKKFVAAILQRLTL